MWMWRYGIRTVNSGGGHEEGEANTRRLLVVLLNVVCIPRCV